MPFIRPGAFFAVAVAVLADGDSDAILRSAQAYLNAGRYTAAMEGGEQAAKLFRQSGDLPKTARSLTISGLAQMYSGTYEPALRNFNEARRLSQQANDLDYQVTSLNNIGTVFYFEGRYSDAMESYRQALEQTEAIPDAHARASRRELTIANTAILYQTLGQHERALTLYNDLLNAPKALPLSEQAQLLANVGVLRRRLGDPSKALLTYRAAQALYKKTGLLDGEIAVLNNIGIVQAMDLAEHRAAAQTFTDSLQLAEKSGNRPLAVQAHLYRGETFLRSGDLDKAHVDFTAAADGAAQLGEQEEAWKAACGLARVAIRRGDPETGRRLLRSATSTIERLRGSLGSASLRSAFLADKRSVYDLLIENTTAIDEVFHSMEQSRGRVARDRVAPGPIPSLQTIASAVPQGTAILEYWVGESSAAVLWISHKDTSLKRWPMSPAVRDNINAVRAALSDPKREGTSSAAVLAGELLNGVGPLHDPEIRRLIIVPDGPLGQIPFEALPFDSGLVIDRFTVSYSPSAALASSSSRRRAVRWFWQPSIEAFADPAPGPGTADDLNGSFRFARLPEAGTEIHGIADALGGRSILREGSEARKALLLTDSRAPVLHFATHAFADVENPGLSYVLLAPSTPSQRYDYLFQKEIGQLPLSGVDLLTLSACETAVGKIIPGEGVQSFSGAFLAAGIPSVVTSLWSVDDKASSGLMIRFYRRMASGETVEEALRHAKLEFLHSSSAAHPAYWAAFIVNGDGALQLPYVIGWKWMAIPVLLIAAIILSACVRTAAGTARR